MIIYHEDNQTAAALTEVSLGIALTDQFMIELQGCRVVRW